MNHPFLSPKSLWSKLWTRLPVTLMAVVLLASSPVRADDALAAKTLKERGRFWESQGRLDLAAPAWKLLLQIEPQNSEALAGIAQFELSNNRPDAASAIIDELKKQPELNRDAIRRIENAAARKPINTKQLDQARAAARAGKANEAVGLYRQLLGDKSPTGPIALEYYQTLGGTTNGWDEARKGLERLNADEPGNPAVALAYAQHLTYRAGTRREGIRLLADLARNPRVQAPALSAWRQALIWLQASRSDTSLFQAYLNVRPNDATIRARVANLNRVSAPRPPSASSIAQRNAFNALNSGDVDAAEKQFESLLQANPQNADALGGLGVVRLKQERFADAENLLSAASRNGKNKQWAEALNSSRFWLAMQDGQAKLEEKRPDLAQESYLRAQSLIDTMKDTDERREAKKILLNRKASMAMEAKQFADAERMLMDQTGPLDIEGQELLAWAQYHQNKMVEAAKGFTEAYRVSPSKGIASGLVSSYHKQKSYPALLALIQQDTGPLRDLVAAGVQQKIAQGENRFEVNGEGQLVEIDPVIILTDDVLWPATLALLKENDPKKAYDLLLPVEAKLVEIGEYSMLNVLGKAATEVGDETTALRVLRMAAEGTEDETFYFMWAQSLIQFGRDEEAEKIMLKQLEYLDVDGLTLLGWTQSRLGKPDQAAERFAAAYAKQPSEDSAQALVFSSVQSKNYPLLLASLDKHPGGPLDALVAPDIRTQIAAGKQNFSVGADARLTAIQSTVAESERGGFSLKLEPRLRSKSGVAGEGQLRQRSVVTTLEWQGGTHQASLEVEGQNATDATDRVQGQRWYAKWGMKMTPNIGVQLGVGRTLSNGVVGPATVGEAGVNYSTRGGNAGVRLFRRGNEESLLALSGTPDVITGIRSGRVLERGAVFSAYHKPERWENLGYLVVSRLDGQTVADNRMVQAYARSMWDLESVPGLSLGVDVGTYRFNRNLSAFQPGHGGYFSPSNSTTIGAIGKYTTRLGDLDLLFLGGLGWSYNRTDAEAGNPITGANPGQFPATTSRSLAYQARIQGLKPLTPNWNLGFGWGTQNGSGFADWRANVFIQRRWTE